MRRRDLTFMVAVLAFALVFGPIAMVQAADLRSNILPKFIISPDTSVSNNDNTTGTIIDTLGYGSVTYIIQTGTLADSDVTLTPSVEECASATCVTAGDNSVVSSLIGTVADATFAATDDNTVKSIGTNQTKRYSKIVITPASNTGAARFSVIAILGHPKYPPAQ